MSKLKHIQISATLVFDDGCVVNFATPVWSKDIRDGGVFFSDELTQEILINTGNGFAHIVEEKSLDTLHGLVKAELYDKSKDRRKPKPGDNFSNN